MIADLVEYRLRSSTLDSLHTWVSPGSIGCEYTYSGPFREARISVQPLWGFSSSNPDRSQSRAEHCCFTVFLALFHSIFSSVSHYFRHCFIVFFFIAVSQCFWRCFTIFVIAVLNNYWHCFQLYSGPCFCTVLFSAIFQLYSRSYYCPALFLPFPALFPALLLYSFNPGHVTVQHYSRPFQVLFSAVLLYSFITSHLFAVRG